MENGLIQVGSSLSVAAAFQKLEALAQAAGLTVFARIDHSGEAEKVGLRMRPTKLLIFGSPKAGTPVMVASPSVSIDLPLKVLVWEDEKNNVWLTYNDPEYLRQRHEIPSNLMERIAGVGILVNKAAH